MRRHIFTHSSMEMGDGGNEPSSTDKRTENVSGSVGHFGEGYSKWSNRSADHSERKEQWNMNHLVEEEKRKVHLLDGPTIGQLNFIASGTCGRKAKSPSPKRKRAWDLKRNVVVLVDENKEEMNMYTEFTTEIKIIRNVTCGAVIRLLKGKDKFQSWMGNILTEMTEREPISDGRRTCSAYGRMVKVFYDLQVRDFCGDICLRNLRESAMEFEVVGSTERSRCALSYMRGLLTRKGEVAVVPLPRTEYQLLLFNHEDQQAKEESEQPKRDAENIEPSIIFGLNPPNNEELFDGDFIRGMQSMNFVSSLRAILVKRFTIVFDLDDTLVKCWQRTRQIHMEQLAKNAGYAMASMTILGEEYMCSIRPGTTEVLRWASNVMNVQFFTNAIWEYGREVLKILDPNQEHILQHVDLQCTDERSRYHLNRVLKSREVMRPMNYLPKNCGLKELDRWEIDTSGAVILDDDSQVWSKTNQRNLLNFERVIAAKNARDFFVNVREASWEKISRLQMFTLLSRRKSNDAESTSAMVTTMGMDNDLQNSQNIIMVPPSQMTTLSQELVAHLT